MADSTSEAVGDLTKTAVEALGITDGDPATAVSVVKRKNPGLPEGASGTATQISVSVLEDRAEPLDGRRKLKTYTLVVVIVRPGGAKAGDNATVRQWRDQIERTIDDRDRDTFSGLPAATSGIATINRADYQGGKLPFDVTAAPKDYDYSALNFAVEVIETRATS